MAKTRGHLPLAVFKKSSYQTLECHYITSTALHLLTGGIVGDICTVASRSAARTAGINWAISEGLGLYQDRQGGLAG